MATKLNFKDYYNKTKSTKGEYTEGMKSVLDSWVAKKKKGISTSPIHERPSTKEKYGLGKAKKVTE